MWITIPGKTVFILKQSPDSTTLWHVYRTVPTSAHVSEHLIVPLSYEPHHAPTNHLSMITVCPTATKSMKNISRESTQQWNLLNHKLNIQNLFHILSNYSTAVQIDISYILWHERVKKKICLSEILHFTPCLLCGSLPRYSWFTGHRIYPGNHRNQYLFIPMYGAVSIDRELGILAGQASTVTHPRERQ